MDGRGGVFPQHPAGPMERAVTGKWEAGALASGHTLVLSPEDPARRVVIEDASGSIALYDGRNKAQNGWYVVRGMLPAGRTGQVLEWVVTPSRIPGWTRPPVIAHSQIGYHPRQSKVAALETGRGDAKPATMSLLRIEADGRFTEKLKGPLEPWGEWLRYDYARFDFTSVTEPGLYVLEAGGERSEPFRIAVDVFEGSVWQSSLDTFLPVQMDHVFVNDNYRVWHGASHLEDAIQAPAGHEHFDLYSMGPTTDSPFAPGEHIPLNQGGWFDAGDFDLRTQSQYAVVNTLVIAQETFGIDWDQTTVDQKNRWVVDWNV
jgi:hypothetical protein